MPIIYVVLGLVLLGVVLYLVNNKLPWIDPGMKTFIKWVVIILLILWVLKSFGLWEALLSIRV